MIFAICRNPVISNVLIRWALIGSSLVEVSGSIGSVYSLLIPYAFPLLIFSLNYLIFISYYYYLKLIIDNIKAINKGNPINLLVFISKALYGNIINEYLIINDWALIIGYLFPLILLY